MPHIEEEDLLALHGQIEREQQTNIRLLDQIHAKNKEYDRSVQSRNMAWVISGIIIVGSMVSIWYQARELEHMEHSFRSCHSRNSDLLQQYSGMVATADSLEKINALFLGRIAEDQVVYTVQVAALEKQKLPLRSGNTNYISGPGVKGLTTFSIGVYYSLEEAQILRNALVKMGFGDAFIASYKNGVRVRIESAG